MKTYVTISVGSTPQTASPIVASGDRDIVRATLHAIVDRVESVPTDTADVIAKALGGSRRLFSAREPRRKRAA